MTGLRVPPLLPVNVSPRIDRRTFIITSGGVFAGVILASCDGGTQPGQGGTVEVEVTGLAPSGPAGSVEVSRPGVPESIDVDLPTANGSGVSLGTAVNVPPGTYTVSYTPPAGRTVVGESSKNVEVAVGPAVRITFVTAAAPTAAIVFASDWSSATGNTTAAVRDVNKWDTAYNIASPTADRVSVVAATGLGFPAGMANALAIRYEANTDVFCGINKQNGWSLPGVGGVLCRRLYFRHTIAGSSGVTHHPVQSAFAAGTCPYAAEWVMDKGDTFNFQIATLVGGQPDPNQHRWQTQLSRGQTYRVEERYERTGTTTWKLHVRVYDSAGALVRQNADFACAAGHGSHTLANQLDIVTPDPECMRHMFIVNQGVGAGRGSDDANNNRIYYGGFAVSLTDWCGPYAVGEGD